MPGAFVGYDQLTKGYRIYIPQLRHIAVSKDVIFDKQTFCYPTSLPSARPPPEAVQFFFPSPDSHKGSRDSYNVVK